MLTTKALEQKAAKKATEPKKMSKGDRQAKLKSLVGTAVADSEQGIEAILPTSIEEPNPSSPPEPTSPPPSSPEDPKSPVVKADDQTPPATDSPKSKKKREKKTDGENAAVRESVTKWKLVKKFEPHQVITIVKADAKKRKAGERFAYYRSGMTVKEYQDAMEKTGRKPRQTMGDIRWDFAQGFINVE
jgi:hypothetical protein